MDSYIHFDDSTAIYSGGQIISGRIEFNLSKSKAVKGVKIIIKGKAIVQWSESRSGKNKSSKRFYNKENYFKETFHILDGINGEAIVLPAGQHIYPFKYLLPPHLPPSYESHYGNIRYSVKGILMRPWKFDHKVKTSFVVETPPDFIENPRIREPATLTMEKTFGFLMFKSNKPLTGALKVPYSGFICGKSIPLILEINNPSSVAVKGIKIELNKIKMFRANRPYDKEKRQDKTLWKSHIDCHIDSNTSKIIQHQVDIPHFDIHNLTNCHIIDIDYEIKVEVQTVGLHLNMIGNLPIFPMNSILQSNVGTPNFYPVNNIPNTGTTNFNPVNNISNTGTTNFYPVNNIPNTGTTDFYPVNNIPNIGTTNFYPVNNIPNAGTTNFYPINNIPNIGTTNFYPVNNIPNTGTTNFYPVNNIPSTGTTNFYPVNNIPNTGTTNFYPVNNIPNTGTTNLYPVNNIPNTVTANSSINYTTEKN